MYIIEIHKLLKNGNKNKNYTVILNWRPCRIQIYHQKLALNSLKYRKRALNLKKLPEIVENYLLVTFRSLLEVKMTFYGHMSGCIVFGRSKSI